MLVDDHAVVREGYRRLVELEPDLRVLGEHADADAAYADLQQRAGDFQVVVLDLSMPGRSGIDLLRRVRARWPSLKVLVFSMHDSLTMVAQALRAGAAGFVTKSSAPEVLVAALRRVVDGHVVLSPDVQDAALLAQDGGATGAEAPLPHLTLSPREFDVLRLLAAGRGVDDVARQIGVSAKTVYNYQSLIRQKLGVETAIEMVRYAQMHGLTAVPGQA